MTEIVKFRPEEIDEAIEGLDGLRDIIAPLLRRINGDGMGEQDAQQFIRQLTLAKHALIAMGDFLEEKMTLMRAHELAKAEKDGRLVVLPVKIGDKIFRLFDGEIQDLLVSNVIYRDGGSDACKILVECIPFHRSYWREDFGKTIFLTRKEAEAALKKREADNEAN